MRFHILFIAALCCATGVGAATASEPLSTAGTKRASVQILDCDYDGRQAVFRAAMRRVRGTARMRLRFTLLQRAPGRRFERVRAPGLRRWKRSHRGVRRFAHRQRVRGLRQGLAYRARVDFRWLDRQGHVIRRRRAGSRTCSLAGPLPNLKATAIDGLMDGAVERYSVTVVNAGRAGAPATGLRLGVDGHAQPAATVPALGPGESATVRVSGRPCANRVRAFVDPDGFVAESREGDNVLVRGCP